MRTGEPGRQQAKTRKTSAVPVPEPRSTPTTEPVSIGQAMAQDPVFQLLWHGSGREWTDLIDDLRNQIQAPDRFSAAEKLNLWFSLRVTANVIERSHPDGLDGLHDEQLEISCDAVDKYYRSMGAGPQRRTGFRTKADYTAPDWRRDE